jgi:hypothetical protein
MHVHVIYFSKNAFYACFMAQNRSMPEQCRLIVYIIISQGHPIFGHRIGWGKIKLWTLQNHSRLFTDCWPHKHPKQFLPGLNDVGFYK